jgi:hypothetical protein
MMRTSQDSNTNLLLLAVGVAGAVATFLAWPSIRGHLAPSWEAYSALPVNMHLDPDVQPGRVEDRRGELGGGDLSRLGPPPQWRGPRGDTPAQPWNEAGGADPEPREAPGSRQAKCWDTVEHRRVDISLCDRPSLPRNEARGAPGGREAKCLDSVKHRYVDASFCERERTGRR